MEAPISEQGTVDLHLHVVQSIRLSVEAMKQVFQAGVKDPRKESRSCLKAETLPSWLRRFNEYGRVYDHLVGLELHGGDAADLREDLAQRRVLGRTSIAPYVDPRGIEAFLVFDYRTMQWFAVYGLALTFPLADLLSMTDPASDACEAGRGASRLDLYNTLRNVFVNSDGVEEKAAWVADAEAEARRRIVQTVAALSGVSLALDDVNVVESNGNVTNFFIPQGVADEDREKLRAQLGHTNRYAERINEGVDPVFEDEHVLYLFKGRFHTIVLDDARKEIQYMPIQFHAQYLWCYLSTMSALVRDAEDSMLAKKFGKSSRNDSVSMDAIINSVQYTVFMNAGFKRAIESDGELIFKKVEKLWHLESSLGQLERFSEHLSGHLQRAYQRLSSDAERRQSNALFLLSALQILALLSVWTDYLSLLKDDTSAAVMRLDPFSFVFGGADALLGFNVALPLVLIGFSTMLILYVAISRRRR